ncbi:uncharacterized protein LOC128554217 [Mercenaria mercenaria]|uniref:uncharacterized protein LOC128554217 n=1 Tax=Mercenaria mercenaria TaxID=6596 RepID=UPI00234E53FA|nr:uncharacterized protein LOC128554217 [Mercenaria mercenaria]
MADKFATSILKLIAFRGKTDGMNKLVIPTGLLSLTVAMTLFRSITGIFCVTSDCTLQYTAGVYFLIRSFDSILFWAINLILAWMYKDDDDDENKKDKPLQRFPFQLFVCISVLGNLAVFVVCAKLVFENFNEIEDICPSTSGRGTAANIVVISDCVYITVFVLTTIVSAARE